MLNYKGGNPAKDGFYWKKGEWEMVTVQGKDGRLPGGIESEYVKVPGLLYVPIALTVSGLFVIFLPFIGFGMLFVLIGTKAGKGLRAMARHPRLEMATTPAGRALNVGEREVEGGAAEGRVAENAKHLDRER